MLNLRVGGAIAIVAGAAFLFAAGDGLARGKKKKGKKGKVVRVERSSVGAGLVLWCGNPRSDGAATCYGQSPQIGDIGTVMDQQGVRATVKVTGLTGMPDGCGNVTSWEVASQVQSGDLSGIYGVGAMLFRWDTTSASRSMDLYNPPVTAPGKYAGAGEYMLGATDDDADGKADLIVTWFYCDAAGSSSPAQSGHYCLVHYGLEGGSYKDLRFDIVKNCP